jgi:SSS family transporter
LRLAPVDYLIIALYFAFVLGIGWLIRKRVASSEDFLTSSRSVPLWITSLAFIAANMGAQEMIGMCASGAKYGLMTAHFYWIGAIPAMIFVGVFMMPFYYGSRARSVPEYLRLRFDEKTRTFNAVTFAAMTVFSSGISMYALGRLFQLVLGWSFTASVLLSAGIVLAYTYLGGLTSAMYNEVLQFFLIVLGFTPLAILAVHRAGGWEGISSRLPAMMTHSWAYTYSPSANAMGVEVFGLVMGLGFVLSFGYWCTDFLVIQRALAANSMTAARNTPLVAAFPKMLIPFIVIVPGIAAMALMQMNVGYSLPPKGSGYDYDLTLTTLMASFYPSGLLGVGLTALMASFMSGMAGEHHRTQHGLDLRHLPGPHPQGRPRQSLPHGGPADNDHGHRAFHRHRLPRPALQQHHGSAPARVRVRERSAVCNLPAGDVLETRHRARRFHRPAGWNGGGCADARTDAGRGQGRLDRPAARISLHHGAEFLDRDRSLDDLLPGNHRGQPAYQAATRVRAGQPGLRHHAPAASGTAGPLVPASGCAGRGRWR